MERRIQMTLDLHDCQRKIDRLGFLFLRGDEWSYSKEALYDRALFLQAWHDLPPDPYLHSDFPFRRRRHGHLTYDRLLDQVVPSPPGGYYQSSEHNQLFGGMRRTFAAVPEPVMRSAFLADLVKQSVAIIGWSSRRVDVHVHLVRIVGRPEGAGLPTPEGAHRDGFDFVSIHMIERHNVSGGRTLVYSNEGVELFSEILTSPLDSLYLQDDRVKHETTSIEPLKNGDATRDVLLLSYALTDDSQF
jgi:hypothetical protein